MVNVIAAATIEDQNILRAAMKLDRRIGGAQSRFNVIEVDGAGPSRRLPRIMAEATKNGKILSRIIIVSSEGSAYICRNFELYRCYQWCFVGDDNHRFGESLLIERAGQATGGVDWRYASHVAASIEILGMLKHRLSAEKSLGAGGLPWLPIDFPHNPCALKFLAELSSSTGHLSSRQGVLREVCDHFVELLAHCAVVRDGAHGSDALPLSRYGIANGATAHVDGALKERKRVKKEDVKDLERRHLRFGIRGSEWEYWRVPRNKIAVPAHGEVFRNVTTSACSSFQQDGFVMTDDPSGETLSDLQMLGRGGLQSCLAQT